jgi:DnaB-like helicase N terminal domain
VTHSVTFRSPADFKSPDDTPAAGSRGRDNGILRAERALLGAVLHEPAARGPMLDHVAAADFQRPWHAQVHAAMQRIRARGELPGPHQVRAELRHDPDVPGHVHGQAWLITDLMHDCPRPAHAPAYAGMVAEAGIRRGLRHTGRRMEQVAAGGPPNFESALDVTARARADLDKSRVRWQALPPEARREIPGPSRDGLDAAAIARQAKAIRDDIAALRENLWAESQAGIEERLSGIARRLAEVTAAQADRRERQAARQAAREARPATPAGEQASCQCLKDLTARPEAIEDVRPWLRPDHFATAGQGDTYAVLRDMRAARKPIDPVTASREARRRGVEADLDDGTATHAETSARDLQRHATISRVGQVGRGIQAAASDQTAGLTSVFRTADRGLRQAEAEAGLHRHREVQPKPEPASARAVVDPHTRHSEPSHTPEPAAEAAR